jgi:hypothetical protein
MIGAGSAWLTAAVGGLLLKEKIGIRRYPWTLSPAPVIKRLIDPALLNAHR